ncbi:serine/threonine-protein kinase [Streptomyces carpaticus]|uniref:non-specific serine/threonine protein kinase n=1 Tax=Streptomyces carpaticus TaxID=285558 RepID=A0ABV4ZMN2_9ACTN
MRVAGRYELTKQLGKGGMGLVWEGYDQHLDRRVAVKFLDPKAHGGPVDTAQERFRREARTMARLEHPGIPMIHDVGVHTDGRMYVVMQRVPGLTLEKILALRGRFPVRWAAAVTAQIAEVLAHAHGLGIIHRDLKPANLMLTPAGVVKVLDFGIATVRDLAPDQPRLTALNAVAGTPGYIAPERILGSSATPRSDLYELGCVLYELLAGVRPLTSAAPAGLNWQHVHEIPAPVTAHCPELPPDMAALVGALLEKRPEDRPADAAEVAARIGPWGVPSPDSPLDRDGADYRSALARAARDTATATTPDGGYDPTAPYTRRAYAAPDSASDHAAPVRQPVPVPAARPAEPTEEPTAEPEAGDEGGDRPRDRAARLAASGRFSQAADLLAEALAGRSPGARDADDRLAMLGYRREAGQVRQALVGYQELESALRDGWGPSPQWLACKVGVADCLRELGRTPEALECYRQLVADQQGVLGASAAEVFATRYQIAVLTAGAGFLRQASEHLLNLRKDQQAALSPNDPAHERVAALMRRLEQVSNDKSL